MQKPPKSFWQIWNMSFGFLGIQFGWGLQMANMSAIYEYLGARADQIPILWLAAPLTGLLVQPIIGHASDHTWTRLGRRRPYFLAGAILSSVALILMPRCSALWMAAGLLWILDSSINISMEPFRAFVADLLPEEQRTEGFAMQSLFIGLGAVVASALPWLLTNVFHVGADTTGTPIPHTVRLSFYMGSAAFFGAVLWTIVTTKRISAGEPRCFPAEESREARPAAQRRRDPAGDSRDAADHAATGAGAVAHLAGTCSACGCISRWRWRAMSSARSTRPRRVYTRGVEWAGICFGMYSAVCFAFSFFLPTDGSRAGTQEHA